MTEAAAVRRLCAAVEQSMPMLATPSSIEKHLTAEINAARAALDLHPDDASLSLTAIKAIRYILIEACDGPVAAILADSAARLLGDDTGKLFS